MSWRHRASPMEPLDEQAALRCLEERRRHLKQLLQKMQHLAEIKADMQEEMQFWNELTYSEATAMIDADIESFEK